MIYFLTVPDDHTVARAHPGRCVRTLSRVRNGHGGRHRAPKWPKKAINGNFVPKSRHVGSKLVELRESLLDQVWHNKGDKLDLFPGLE